MLAQQIFNGLALGMGYALIAVGYSLVFGILRLVNFSHGAIYAFGAEMAMVFIGLNFGIVPGIIASMIVTGLLGIAIDKVALEPLRKKHSMPIASLITTIGISNIITNLLIVFLGSEKRNFPQLFNFGSVKIGSVVISSTQIMMCVVSLILMDVLVFIVYKTKIGLAMRASEQNAKAANLMGINVNFVISFTFFLAGMSATIAGALVGGYYQNMGFMAGLKAFAAAVLGGIGSLPGALLGGLIVGVSESMAASFMGSTYRDSIAFVILIIVLIVRPHGLFGRKGITKV